MPQVASDSRIARLAASPVAQWGRSRPLAAFVTAWVLLAGIGAALGWVMRPGDPLRAQGAITDRIPRKDTVQEQYFAAMTAIDSEAAWKAVVEHPSGESLFKRRAQEQLAMLFLREGRLDDAEAIYREFTAQRASDPALAATGYAGLAVIAGLRNDHEESQTIIGVHLRDLREHLDPSMTRLVREAIRVNVRELGDRAKQDLEDLFPPEPPPEDEPL